MLSGVEDHVESQYCSLPFLCSLVNIILYIMNNFLNPPVENLTLDGFLYPLARQYLSPARSTRSSSQRTQRIQGAHIKIAQKHPQAGRHDAGASCSHGENLRYQNKLACSDPSSTPLCILSDPYTDNARISSQLFNLSVTSAAL